ncbi:MAG: LacI family transcriptional regulator, partial [Clostridia bacterium]|nr:LacI family transcriptional regulator [Clostridia bacterium]
MKRILIMLLLLCLLAGCGASGGGNEETAGEQQSLLLGFSQLGWESAWRLANTESIKSAAEEAGVSLMYENAEQK